MSGSVRLRYGLGIVVLLGFVPACQSTNSANTDVLKIGAYSVVREVLHDGVLPAFAAEWKSRTGRDLEFEESYNGSGRPGAGDRLGIRRRRGDPLARGRTWTLLVKAGLVKPAGTRGRPRG